MAIDDIYDATFAPLQNLVRDHYLSMKPVTEEFMNTFDGVLPLSLQAYNRTRVALNLRDDHGPQVMANYVSRFSSADQNMMTDMLELMRDAGKQGVVRALQRAVHVMNEEAVDG